MANAVLNDESKQGLTNSMLASSPFASGLSVALLTTATSLSHTDTLSTYTSNEASWSGYSRVSITSWDSATLSSDKHALAKSGVVCTFSNTSGSSVNTNGWFLVDSGGSKAVLANLFPSTIAIPDGESITFSVYFSMFHEIAANP